MTKGAFLIFTSDMNISASNILHFYREKDADEKMFEQIKIYMKGARARTHNERTTSGKGFVIFLSCIVRSYIQQRLRSYERSKSTSLKNIFNQLSDIKIAKYSSQNKLTKALTKQQKNILNIFNADVDILQNID